MHVIQDPRMNEFVVAKLTAPIESLPVSIVSHNFAVDGSVFTYVVPPEHTVYLRRLDITISEDVKDFGAPLIFEVDQWTGDPLAQTWAESARALSPDGFFVTAEEMTRYPDAHELITGVPSNIAVWKISRNTGNHPLVLDDGYFRRSIRIRLGDGPFYAPTDGHYLRFAFRGWIMDKRYLQES